MKFKLFILLTMISGVWVNCTRRHEQPPDKQQIRETQEALVGANRLMVQKDKARIEEYARRNHPGLQESESGLWYEIIKAGNGLAVHEDMQVTLAYEVSLLDGTVCYSSDSLGLKEFRVGKGGVESGLDEGIRMLREGSEAIFILPPHLAHGLQGDGDKIPARSVIVYHVKLLKVQS